MSEQIIQPDVLKEPEQRSEYDDWHDQIGFVMRETIDMCDKDPLLIGALILRMFEPELNEADIIKRAKCYTKRNLNYKLQEFKQKGLIS